jgi:hypothetical protein
MKCPSCIVTPTGGAFGSNSAHVDTPTPSKHRDRAEDQKRSDAALEADGDDAWRTLSGVAHTRRPQQMLDRTPGHEDGKRQDDDDQNEPEARAYSHCPGRCHPKHPQQHEADRQRHVARNSADTVRFG